jgi:hypothetical protein
MGLFSRKPAAPPAPFDLGPDPIEAGFNPKTRWEKSRLLEAVGCNHYQPELQAVCEAAQKWNGYLVLRLQHEPHSPHGNNVVAILAGGKVVGHVAKNQARNLAPRLQKIGGHYDVLGQVNNQKTITVTAWLPNGKP